MHVEVALLKQEVRNLTDASLESRERAQKAQAELTNQLGLALAEKEAVKSSLASEVAKVRACPRGQSALERSPTLEA